MAAESCSRLYDLWGAEEPSHCSGLASYTVLDFILQSDQACSCPGIRLTYSELQRDGVNGIDGLDGADSLAISPDGKYLYASGILGDGLAVFQREEATGLLTFIEFHRDGMNAVDGLEDTRQLALSPDGKHLYTVGFSDDAVALFWVNQNP